MTPSTTTPTLTRPPTATPAPAPTATPEGPTLTLIRTVLEMPGEPTRALSWAPWVVITGDGRLYQHAGPEFGDATDPLAPLVAIRESQISVAGMDLLAAAIRDTGILGAGPNLIGDAFQEGTSIGRLEIQADGRDYVIRGDPWRILASCGNTQCPAEPGTPDAFTVLWRLLDFSAPQFEAELTSSAPYTIEAWAVFSRSATEPGQGLDVEWPLPGSLAEFGEPIVSDPRRCGLVTGADAAALNAAIDSAFLGSRWVDPVGGGVFQLELRPLLPGDVDVCHDFAPA